LAIVERSCKRHTRSGREKKIAGAFAGETDGYGPATAVTATPTASCAAHGYGGR
jgi:hypothetical protein